VQTDRDVMIHLTQLEQLSKMNSVVAPDQETTNHWHTLFANNYKKTTEQANKMTLNNGTGRFTLMDKQY
jgi:hypothetical protein